MKTAVLVGYFIPLSNDKTHVLRVGKQYLAEGGILVSDRDGAKGFPGETNTIEDEAKAFARENGYYISEVEPARTTPQRTRLSRYK